MWRHRNGIPGASPDGGTGLRLVEAHHRLALWAGVFCVIALLAAFAVSRSAAAVPMPGGHSNGLPTALLEEEEGEEFEAEEGPATAAECAAEAQEEIEEGEPVETECEVAEEAEADPVEAGEAPEECLLRTAAATVSTSPTGDTVHLSLRYTSWTPATVAVSYRLRGNKGGLALGHATKHFGKKGVLKLTADLSRAETSRATAAKEFDVTVQPINTPGYCGKILAQRLNAHKAAGKGRIWTD